MTGQRTKPATTPGSAPSMPATATTSRASDKALKYGC
jgi:hypothetical protein